MYPFRIEEADLYKQYPQKVERKVEKISPVAAGNNNKNKDRNQTKKNFNAFLEEELYKIDLKC